MADFTIQPPATPLTADGLITNQQSNVLSSAPISPAQLGWLVNVGPVAALVGNALTPQNVTLGALSGTVNGTPWSLSVGQILILDVGLPTQELVQILATNAANSTVNVLVRNNHAGQNVASVMFLDAARSAMQQDLVSPRGAQMVNLAGLDPITNTVNAARAATVDNIPGRGATVVASGAVNAYGGIDRIRTTGAGRFETSDQDLLAQILIELRTLNTMLVEGLGITSDPDDYRAALTADFPTN